ncbi:hypothetical protein NL676_015344 [Syzygium grande]|nr:hypothetical protein NL676_015344 [Syzygium grande]
MVEPRDGPFAVSRALHSCTVTIIYPQLASFSTFFLPRLLEPRRSRTILGFGGLLGSLTFSARTLTSKVILIVMWEGCLSQDFFKGCDFENLQIAV